MEVALIDGPYKLIRNRRAGTSLLFDLEQDPGETRNLAAARPQTRRALEQTLLESLEAEP
jgi:hypothetical protein